MKAEEQHVYCNLPEVPQRPLDERMDPNRMSLIRYIEKKWANHTLLHYYFFDTPNSWRGDEQQKQAVRDAFTTWKNLGIGLSFKEVYDPNEAEVRVGFEPGGSWSYVGRDCIDIAKDPAERTTNYGWDLTTPYGRDTALHELGHVLGFPHEHQNPHAGIEWDENAVYRHFAGPPNYWNRQKTEFNVLRKISPSAVTGSEWDKNSIMHYQFSAGLILVPEEYKSKPLIPAPDLSSIDISEALKLYPSEDEKLLPELAPFRSAPVHIEPAGQLDYIIKPKINRKYTMQTFGDIDTVMVLFEEIDGEPVFLDGDDDSGSDLNAKIRCRLIRGRKYILRIRLYYAGANGSGAVMLW